MDAFTKLYNSAKLQTITFVALVLSLIGMFLPFVQSRFTILRETISESGNFFEVADFNDLIVLALLGVALVFTGMILMMKFNGKEPAARLVLQNVIVNAAVGGIAVILSTLTVLQTVGDGFSMAWGYFVFVLVNVVIAGMNGYRAFLQKDAAKEILNSAKSSMQSQAQKVGSSMNDAMKEGTEDQKPPVPQSPTQSM